VEPFNAKFAEFLAEYSKEEMEDITLSLAPVESGCFRLWVMVLHQGGRRTTLTRNEAPELTPKQTALVGLVVALTWEHPRRKSPDPIFWAPRTVVSPREIAGIMEVVKA
jgi:hypothetical protein